MSSPGERRAFPPGKNMIRASAASMAGRRRFACRRCSENDSFCERYCSVGTHYNLHPASLQPFCQRFHGRAQRPCLSFDGANAQMDRINAHRRKPLQLFSNPRIRHRITVTPIAVKKRVQLRLLSRIAGKLPFSLVPCFQTRRTSADAAGLQTGQNRDMSQCIVRSFPWAWYRM